jgi:hypothetical protein
MASGLIDDLVGGSNLLRHQARLALDPNYDIHQANLEISQRDYNSKYAKQIKKENDERNAFLDRGLTAGEIQQIMEIRAQGKGGTSIDEANAVKKEKAFLAGRANGGYVDDGDVFDRTKKIFSDFYDTNVDVWKDLLGLKNGGQLFRKNDHRRFQK